MVRCCTLIMSPSNLIFWSSDLKTMVALSTPSQIRPSSAPVEIPLTTSSVPRLIRMMYHAVRAVLQGALRRHLQAALPGWPRDLISVGHYALRPLSVELPVYGHRQD